jgi:phage-related tail fiber protein
MTMAGVLSIVNGGTGQTTGNSALNAFLPEQSGNVGKYLSTDGTNTSWQVSFVPQGSVIWFAASAPPFGYLEANGAAIDRTAYAALFIAIGTTFGTGDGSTTFNIPDLRGDFIRGWTNGSSIDSGRAFGTQQTDGIRTSTASGIMSTAYIGNSSTGEFYWIYTYGESGSVNAFQGSSVLGLGTANDTRPYNVALLPCIKY